MSGLAARFAFLGNAFLSPDTARLAAQSRRMDDNEFLGMIEAAPLEPEFNRLFLNPAGTPCPPWQSAYGAERHLMSAPHLQALEWYRRYGVEPATPNDPADHIGLLLLFYSRLLDAELPDSERQTFAADHLAWVPAFCENVQSETRHAFYKRVAAETRNLTRDAVGPSVADSAVPN